MVTTHDCQMVKELERRYEQLRKEGLKKSAALAAARADEHLDRFICVSPIIPIAQVRPDRAAVFGEGVIGYFPVHANETVGVFEGAVDLGYRATIDRHSIVTRAAVLSDAARNRLRYALARVDALRSPKFAFQLEEIVNQRIVDIRQESDNPLGVEVVLKNGEVLHFLSQPDPVDPTGPAHQVTAGR
jgi:predicted Holliday junction resolvase-like endonuclease